MERAPSARDCVTLPAWQDNSIPEWRVLRAKHSITRWLPGAGRWAARDTCHQPGKTPGWQETSISEWRVLRANPSITRWLPDAGRRAERDTCHDFQLRSTPGQGGFTFPVPGARQHVTGDRSNQAPLRGSRVKLGRQSSNTRRVSHPCAWHPATPDQAHPATHRQRSPRP